MRRSELALLLWILPASSLAESPAKVTDEGDLNRVTLTAKAAERIGLQLATVERGPQRRMLSVPGTILARPGASASITAPMAGIILSPAHLAEPPLPGTMVTADQIVLRLSPIVAPSGPLLSETKREVKQAEARHDTAEKAAARAEALVKTGAGNRAGLDTAQETLRVAEAELGAARERLARLQRSPMSSDVSLPLRAPMAGVLARIYVSSGQSVSQGDRLADVVDLNRLWVRAEVYSGMLARIDQKAEASVRALGGTELRRATRLDAPPVARTSGSVVELDYALDDGRGFVPALRVEVEVPLEGTGEDALSVPWSAVLYDAHGGAWVYVAAEDLIFVRQRIEVETVIGDRAVLVHGPEPGTRVVTEGATEIFGTEFGIGK